MLILSRKPNEAIIINGNIKIVVLTCREDGKVRLGFIAPPEVVIMREELQTKIEQEHKGENL